MSCDMLNSSIGRSVRDDIENEDDQESFFRYMEENPMAGVILHDEDFLEYDEDGNVIVPEKNKVSHIPRLSLGPYRR